ncbi:MAG: antitoxin VapB family protein [Archaeoglobus sp.]|nr:antitoxin VapB family protein [Archaeoglobus sp.]
MKNIVLRDEVYNKLSQMKREGESFSDVILRLIEEKKERSLEVFERYAGSLEESDLFEVVVRGRKSFEVRDFDI